MKGKSVLRAWIRRRHLKGQVVTADQIWLKIKKLYPRLSDTEREVLFQAL
jgi:hypothetical protein